MQQINDVKLLKQPFQQNQWIKYNINILNLHRGVAIEAVIKKLCYKCDSTL